MVLWHGCEIEKFDNQGRAKAFAAIAPIQPLDLLQGDTSERTTLMREGVKDGRHQAYFYLPAVTREGFSLPESFVNLRYLWSVRQEALSDRVLSIEPSILPSLYSQLFVFFTRFRIDGDPKCPTCGTAVKLELAEDAEV